MNHKFITLQKHKWEPDSGVAAILSLENDDETGLVT
jgi:hypothetical protein